jgi:hypothetical protein
MLPHELHEPFLNATDRARALQQLLGLFRRLEELEELAQLPQEEWPPEQVEQFPTQMTSGHREHPAERLARWRALFAEELEQARAVRDAAVHARLSDAELRTATYLAARLLALAYGQGLEAANGR